MSDDEQREYFDKEKQQKAAKWLEEKWGVRSCECCGHTAWTIAEHLVAPMAYRKGGVSIGGVAYPQIMVICLNCGNTKYVNALMAKVISSEEEESNDK